MTTQETETITTADEGKSVVDQLVRGEGPFLSVYLPAPSDLTDADDRLAVQWHNLARSLIEGGADPERVAALEPMAIADHRGGATRWAISSADGLVATGALPGSLARPIGSWSDAPALTPVLAWTQRRRPHVVVVVDRTGADLLLAGTSGCEPESVTVEGDTEHIHRGKPGGWSQRRFQQRAENTWESNAKEVAAEVTSAVDEIDAELVVVSGDERAVGFLLDHLPASVRDKVSTAEGSRHDERSLDDLVDRVATVEDDAGARHQVAVLDELREHEPAGLAVTDPARVLTALRRHQVETLVCTDDLTSAAERPTALVGRGDPALVAPTGGEDIVGADAHRVPLVDAALRAAVLSGADVEIVPSNATVDRIAALLRWSH